MRVFIGWSGEQSKEIASVMKQWLPKVIQQISDPWMSEHDVPAGSEWFKQIAAALSETRFGIFCLTPDALESKWIHFEAGVVWRTLETSRVGTYLFNLEPTDLKGPLSVFQGSRVNKLDTLKLLRSLNSALPEKTLTDDVLESTFEKWWPDLEEKLSSSHPETRN